MLLAWARAARVLITPTPAAYCLRGPEVFSLDIFDFSERKVGEIPKPHPWPGRATHLAGGWQMDFAFKTRDEATGKLV